MHDLLPAVRTGFSQTFRFGGRMGRAEFWLWIGFLYVIAAGLFLIDLQLSTSGGLPRYSPTDWWHLFVKETLSQSPWAEMILQRTSAAWPRGLTLTMPLTEYMYSAGPSRIVFPLVYFLSVSATARRARDAGYSPFLTILMLYWFMLGAALVVGANFLLGSLSETLAWTIGIPTGMYLVIHWAVSLTFSVLAIYRLAAPTAFELESP